MSSRLFSDDQREIATQITNAVKTGDLELARHLQTILKDSLKPQQPQAPVQPASKIELPHDEDSPKKYLGLKTKEDEEEAWRQEFITKTEPYMRTQVDKYIAFKSFPTKAAYDTYKKENESATDEDFLGSWLSKYGIPKPNTNSWLMYQLQHPSATEEAFLQFWINSHK